MDLKAEWLKKAVDRGFTVNITTSEKDFFVLTHPNLPMCLELYLNEGNFEFTYYHGIIKLSTGRVGSFMNDEHFLKFQNLMENAIYKLKY